MKYLMAENMKVKWKGEFVVANVSKGEFIFDTESSDNNKATLRGIAEANGIVLGNKDNMVAMINKIDQAFSKKKLLEVNAMSDDKKVEELVVAGVAAGKSEDEILVDVVNAIGSFKNAVKIFKRVMESTGMMLTTKMRQEKIQALIDENKFKPESADDVKTFIKTITANVKDTNEKQAYGVLKRWAKKAEVELPKIKATSSRNVDGVRGFKSKVFEFMVDNPAADVDQLKKWIDSQGKDAEKLSKRFMPIFDVAKKMAKKMYDEFSAQQSKQEAA